MEHAQLLDLSKFRGASVNENVRIQIHYNNWLPEDGPAGEEEGPSASRLWERCRWSTCCGKSTRGMHGGGDACGGDFSDECVTGHSRDRVRARGRGAGARQRCGGEGRAAAAPRRGRTKPDAFARSRLAVVTPQTCWRWRPRAIPACRHAPSHHLARPAPHAPHPAAQAPQKTDARVCVCLPERELNIFLSATAHITYFRA